MTSKEYLDGRRKYQRPQGMLWSENSGTLVSGVYVPNGYEVNTELEVTPNEAFLNQFIILSDDNRDPMQFSIDRLERRERMINGRMRSYHIADKLSISTSWSMLPSRAFALDPKFNPDTGVPDLRVTGERTPGEDGSFEILPNSTLLAEQYTSDGGAGGVDILNWYENHRGPFWVFLAYDKYNDFASNKYAHLQEYNQVIEMYISDFSYSVEKRGGSNYDFWNISVTLEEV
jgi:hypothetical protein